MYQLENSWLVDDLDPDVQAARAAKMQTGEQQHNNHYQGWFKAKKPCRHTAFRPRLLAAFPGWSYSCAASSTAHGLTNAACAGKASLKDYVMKDASRVAGPWADHVIYRGQDLIKREHRPGELAETFCIAGPRVCR